MKNIKFPFCKIFLVMFFIFPAFTYAANSNNISNKISLTLTGTNLINVTVTNEINFTVTNIVQDKTGFLVPTDNFIQKIIESAAIKLIIGFLLFAIYIFFLIKSKNKNKWMSFSFYLLFLFLLWIFKEPIAPIIVVAVIIFIYIFVHEMSKDTFIIQDFLVPKKFEAQFGITEKVINRLLKDEIDNIYKEAKELKVNIANKQKFNNLPEIPFSSKSLPPDITIPGIGISFKELLNYIKKSGYFKRLFKYSYYDIHSEIIKDKENWICSTRLDGDTMISESIEWNDKSTIAKIAEVIIKNTSKNVLGKIFIKKGKYKDAIQLLTNDIKSNNYDSETFILRAVAYSNTEQEEKAIDDFNMSIKLNKKNIDGYLALGYIYSDQKKFDKAIENLQVLLKLIIDNNFKADVLAFLGMNYFYKAEKFKEQNMIIEAIKNYGYSIKIYNKSINLRHESIEVISGIYYFRGKTYYKIGLLYMNKKDYNKSMANYQKAILDFSQIIQLNTTYIVDAFWMRGLILTDLGDIYKIKNKVIESKENLKKAIADLKKAGDITKEKEKLNVINELKDKIEIQLKELSKNNKL